MANILIKDTISWGVARYSRSIKIGWTKCKGLKVFLRRRYHRLTRISIIKRNSLTRTHNLVKETKWTSRFPVTETNQKGYYMTGSKSFSRYDMFWPLHKYRSPLCTVCEQTLVWDNQPFLKSWKWFLLKKTKMTKNNGHVEKSTDSIVFWRSWTRGTPGRKIMWGCLRTKVEVSKLRQISLR